MRELDAIIGLYMNDYIIDLPNGRPVIEDLVRRIERYRRLDLKWLLEVRRES